MHMNIYSSIMQNSPKLETTLMSMNSKMDKLWCERHNGILYNSK